MTWVIASAWWISPLPAVLARSGRTRRPAFGVWPSALSAAAPSRERYQALCRARPIGTESTRP